MGSGLSTRRMSSAEEEAALGTEVTPREERVEQEEEEEGLRRRREGGVRFLPAGAESSNSEEEEEEEMEVEERSHGYNLRSRGRVVASGRSALHQILALMVSRGEFRASESPNSGEDEEESSEGETDFWPVRRVRTNKRIAPDQKMMKARVERVIFVLDPSYISHLCPFPPL